MNKIRYSQFGTFTALVLVPIIILMAAMLFWLGFDDPFPAIIILFVIVTLLISLLIFYKLTIQIDDTNLEFWFGNGLVKKKFRLSDIEVCKPVKNPVWYGVGIHLTPRGWLYNVSGPYAIELTFRNKKSAIRIGTDKPEELSEIINRLLDKPVSSADNDTDFRSSGRSGHIIMTIAILALLILPVALIISGRNETRVEFSPSSLMIKGMYGTSINYEDIISIDTLSNLPVIRARTNGYAFGNTLKGNFKLADRTKAKLFVEKGYSPYLYIKTGKNDYYLNFKDPSVTIGLYEKICKVKYVQ